MFVQFKGCLILNHTVMYALTDTKCWWWWSAPLLQIFHVLSIIRVLMWREPVAADAECCCKTSQVARHKGRSRWCGVFDIDSQEITLINVKYLRQEQNYSPFFFNFIWHLGTCYWFGKKERKKTLRCCFRSTANTYLQLPLALCCDFNITAVVTVPAQKENLILTAGVWGNKRYRPQFNCNLVVGKFWVFTNELYVIKEEEEEEEERGK